MRPSIVGIECDRPFEQPTRFGIGLTVAEGQSVAAQYAFVGRQARWRPTPGVFGAGGVQASDERPHNRADDLVLYGEDGFLVAVEAFGPYMLAGRRVDQLSGNTDFLTGLAHATFDKEFYPKFSCHPPCVEVLVAVLE
jgi:hypothetical protein